MKDKYLTINKESKGVYKDKGSKFIAIASPVYTKEDVKEQLAHLRKEYHDARHHCYAYNIGVEKEEYRVNDDGEPSGSAGRPIHNQLLSYDLTNILVVVVRYFGGTKLGIPGLIKAYKNASIDALENNNIITAYKMDKIEIIYPYECMNDVMKIFKAENIEQLKNTFELNCSIVFEIRHSKTTDITNKLEKIDNLHLKII
jgi:uncharacterized YigZ family protein